MKCSEAGLELIKEHEGCKLEAYRDGGGVWTIGVGHTLGVYAGQTITQEEADRLLDADMVSVEKCLANTVPFGITENQHAALCSFVFNLGCKALRDSTLLRKLSEGDDSGAAQEFMRWNHDNGKVIAGLTKRRTHEMELFLA